MATEASGAPISHNTAMADHDHASATGAEASAKRWSPTTQAAIVMYPQTVVWKEKYQTNDSESETDQKWKSDPLGLPGSHHHGGRRGFRTPDLQHVKLALFQLS